MNKGYGSPAKQVGASELKATTKKKSGLSAVALANAGRDMLKSDYGIDDPNMSNKAIADSIKKYKRTNEVRSKVKQGLKKGDNEGEFKGSFGSPAQMKSPAKQTAKSKGKFDGYKSIGESDTEKGAHLIRSRSVKSNTAATDHKMSKTAEGKYKVYKSKSPAKKSKKY